MAGARAVGLKTRQSARPVHLPLHILLGAAGDASSLGAIHIARALSKRAQASVQVLTVSTPFPHVAPSPFEMAPPAVIDADNRRAALVAVQDQLATIRGTASWTVHAVVGWPAEALVDEARCWPASLIVLGIGRHKAVDRLFGPETAIAVARRAAVPMLAVPPDVQELPARVIAAIDFSESSIGAAKLAARLMVADGTLTLVHASALAAPKHEAGSLVDVYSTGAADKLEQIRHEIHKETRRRVQTVMLQGDVVGQLLEYAKQEHCDLIAVGGHELGFVDRILLGSVRTRIIRDAHCSVLIAPHRA